MMVADAVEGGEERGSAAPGARPIAAADAVVDEGAGPRGAGGLRLCSRPLPLPFSPAFGTQRLDADRAGADAWPALREPVRAAAARTADAAPETAASSLPASLTVRPAGGAADLGRERSTGQIRDAGSGRR